jgi:hypothetical protein
MDGVLGTHMFGGELLITYAAAMVLARRNASDTEVARRYGVSQRRAAMRMEYFWRPHCRDSAASDTPELTHAYESLACNRIVPARHAKHRDTRQSNVRGVR